MSISPVDKSKGLTRVARELAKKPFNKEAVPTSGEGPAVDDSGPTYGADGQLQDDKPQPGSRVFEKV